MVYYKVCFEGVVERSQWLLSRHSNKEVEKCAKVKGTVRLGVVGSM